MGHAAQTSSSGGKAVMSPSALANRSKRLWRRQHLEAASLLAQQAALQVHAAFQPMPTPRDRVLSHLNCSHHPER